MRKSIGSLAAVVALAFSAPVLGQGDAETISFEVALDCGIAHAYLGGIMEQEDPGFSNELVQTAGVWLAMAYNRFSAADAEFDAQVDSRTDQLTDELAGLAGEDEVTEYFVTVLSSCEVIRSANAAEYDQAAAMMAEAG